MPEVDSLEEEEGTSCIAKQRVYAICKKVSTQMLQLSHFTLQSCKMKTKVLAITAGYCAGCSPGCSQSC